jgi:hypothetical protein
VAKADKRYTYEWFVTLNFDQWSRSRVWIADQVEANYKAGYLTGAQVKAIWDHQAKVMQDKVDEKNRKDPPKVVEKTKPGEVAGSATAPTTSDDPSFLEKVAQGWGFIFGKTGDALGNAGSAIMGGVTIGSYIVIGVIVLLVLKLFKK